MYTISPKTAKVIRRKHEKGHEAGAIMYLYNILHPTWGTDLATCKEIVRRLLEGDYQLAFFEEE